MVVRTLALTFVALLCFASQGYAQQQHCNTRDRVLQLLSGRYGEVPVERGVTVAGSIVELLRNLQQDTWTLIVTSPIGLSCVIAAGEGWSPVITVDAGPET